MLVLELGRFVVGAAAEAEVLCFGTLLVSTMLGLSVTGASVLELSLAGVSALESV